MRTTLILLAALAAFLLGSGLAGGESKLADDDAALVEHQRFLKGDLERIDSAVRDVQEIEKLRATGLFVLNDEEKKMERKGRKDFHIFLERYRNDTLQVLAIYDRMLGKQLYIDPLRLHFGKALDELVAVEWDEQALDEICDELSEGYGVNLYIKGNLDSRQTMSLKGEMTLLAILLQIENVFHAKLIEQDGELWFTLVGKSGELRDE
jgi:hypothetical protein